MNSRWDDALDRTDAAVAERAERVLSDQRFPALRTRRARVALVVAQVVTIVLMPVVWLAADAVAGMAMVIVSMVVLSLLRRSVRVVADLPDDVLDERLRGRRNAAYLEAYRYFDGLLMVAAAVGLFAFLLNADETDVWTVDLTWGMVMGAFWTLTVMGLALPSMAVALMSGSELPVDPEG
jgi:hypothetical protein